MRKRLTSLPCRDAILLALMHFYAVQARYDWYHAVLGSEALDSLSRRPEEVGSMSLVAVVDKADNAHNGFTD